MTPRFPILWLTGNSGAGKTTLAEGLRRACNEGAGTRTPLDRRVVVLDGDAMRGSISTEDGFSRGDRRRHNLRVARLARVLQEQGFCVAVSVIAPFTTVRREIDDICAPLWIYVRREAITADADHPYEPPEHPALVIDTDRCTPDDAADRFLGFVLERCACAIGAAR